MSQTQTSVVIVDEAVDQGVSELHIACCVKDAFYCKAPYHPESEATAQHLEDEACPRCVDIRYSLLCPPARPRHQHCPIDGRTCPQA